MRGFLTLAVSLHALFTFARAFPQPEKIYGVNLGSWLLIEPWMLPDEWVAMGGEICANCQDCNMSEFNLTKAHPDTADQVFDEHWKTWFTKHDVHRFTELGLNTVRIPLGYWLVEPLVEEGEFYPKGGMRRLRNGLKWLKNAGIAVILDHHALPGVAASNQMFAGLCTSDVQFYTPKNYHRALIWTAVMTAFSHLDPNFGSVFSIQAINEPLQDPNLTPGYGQFQKDFVQTVRAVEDILHIKTETGNVTAVLQRAAHIGNYSDEVKSVLKDSVPVLLQMALEYNPDLLKGCPKHVEPLTTNFMDTNWQSSGAPNPADAKDGPQTYDDHLYYGFGGVADPNPDAYLTHACNLDRIQRLAATDNLPAWVGEWSVYNNFNATDEFLSKFADAQKLYYSKTAGWIWWNFKLENSESAGIYPRLWSYYNGIDIGYLTKDPAAYNDPNVCDPYITPQNQTTPPPQNQTIPQPQNQTTPKP